MTSINVLEAGLFLMAEMKNPSVFMPFKLILGEITNAGTEFIWNAADTPISYNLVHGK